MTEKLKKKTNYHFPLINPVLAFFFFRLTELMFLPGYSCL